MTDYAVAALQPIAQGVMTIFQPEIEVETAARPAPKLESPKGLKTLTRIRSRAAAGDPTLEFYGLGVSALGLDVNDNVLLTLDPGLPGDVALDPNYARTLVRIRTTGTSTPTTIIDEISVSYPSPNVIAIMFASEGFVVFPFQFEVIVFRGNATPATYQATMVGPLFQPITTE
jgi:hypothetical protein